MKKLNFVLCLVFAVMVLSSCAHKAKNDHSEHTSDYKYKSPKAIKKNIVKIIENHEDFDATQKEKLKTTLTESINEHMRLKRQESKLIQAFLDAYIAKQSDINEIKKIKKSISQVYKQKKKLVYSTSSKLKDIIGIDNSNHVFTMEISPFFD